MWWRGGVSPKRGKTFVEEMSETVCIALLYTKGEEKKQNAQELRGRAIDEVEGEDR